MSSGSIGASISYAAYLPSHAYIPGQTKRHAEEAFVTLKQSVRPGSSVTELARSDAFLAGLYFYEVGYYWETHEVLEAVWIGLTDFPAERRFVQGLIQLANGYLKLGMGFPKAAKRLLKMTQVLVLASESEMVMGLEVANVSIEIDRLDGEICLALKSKKQK